MASNITYTVPAHEEEYKSHNAENADDNGQTSEHCGSTEGRGEDCSKVIQAATADFTTILAASKEYSPTTYYI